jgi:hypothetical protein
LEVVQVVGHRQYRAARGSSFVRGEGEEGDGAPSAGARYRRKRSILAEERLPDTRPESALDAGRSLEDGPGFASEFVSSGDDGRLCGQSLADSPTDEIERIREVRFDRPNAISDENGRAREPHEESSDETAKSGDPAHPSGE